MSSVDHPRGREGRLAERAVPDPPLVKSARTEFPALADLRVDPTFAALLQATDPAVEDQACEMQATDRCRTPTWPSGTRSPSPPPR